jgi:hypothetical protein
MDDEEFAAWLLVLEEAKLLDNLDSLIERKVVVVGNENELEHCLPDQSKPSGTIDISSSQLHHQLPKSTSNDDQNLPGDCNIHS